MRKCAITSLLRLADKSDRNYNEIRELVDRELINAKAWYKTCLDYIDCDIYVREQKYDLAIDNFKEKLIDYKDTPMEVDMLVRISQIYSDYLKDKVSALDYANKAAEVNPGQCVVRVAYDALGINYDPSQYKDRFEGMEVSYDSATEPDEKAIETNSEINVSVSPNPANPATMLNYTIKTPSHVKLSVYSINGQKVATLVDGHMSAGMHSVRFDGSKLASGLYFYKLESAKFNKTGKIMLVK